MPSSIAFITLFLGIVSGKQVVQLRADASVAFVRITVAGAEVARLTQAPWRVEIDLGPELVPRELQAIGYDVNGSEVGRASQFLNLPHEYAEVDIELLRIGAFPDGAQLRWHNLEYVGPKSAVVTFDGLPLRVDSRFRVRFPQTDWTRPHVVDAMMRFVDGIVARREVVMDGASFFDSAKAELTPVLLVETSTQHPASFDGCLSIDGSAVRVAAVDKDLAHVVFVQDPDPHLNVRALDPTGRASNALTRMEVANWARLDEDTMEEILWPVARRFADQSSGSVSRLFEHTADFQPRTGLIGLLTFQSKWGFNLPRQYADAVAVAGGDRALLGGRRRAVVLVLSERQDVSGSDPGAARRYLASIGVPLFVWSPVETSADATARWGTIEDISTIDHLRAAAARLRQTLAAQRIAWIHADALSALRVKADERCGFAAVAH